MPPIRRKVIPEDLFTPRSRGCLLGLAIGDALGSTYEGRRLRAPQFPELADGPFREMRGGGNFNLKPGQVTDDTQMATALATSLRELRVFDAEDIRKRYLQWLPHAFDAGEQTRAALELSPPHSATRILWIQSGKRAAGNGSLMRTAPLAVYFAKSPTDLLRTSLEESAITHFDPRCRLACFAFNTAIATALNGTRELTADEMVQAAQVALSDGAAELTKLLPDLVQDITVASEELKADLQAARNPDPQLYGPELHLHAMEGFVRVAFRLAFWELMHAPSFEAALIDVINRGGDADTNAAITGALMGSLFGEEALPKDWADSVIHALDTMRGPLRDLYHPNQLLLLLD